MAYRVNKSSGNGRGIFGSLSVTAKIIIFTSIFSIVEFVLIALRPESIDYLALKPSNILAGKYLWTLITHMFAHGGIGHLLINMFVLFSLGGLCERIIGKKRFFWFYVVSGLVAGILSVIFAEYFGVTELGARIFGGPEVYMVGASGAIFAIAGLFVVLLPRLRFAIIFLPFWSFPAYIIIPVVLILTWVASVAADLPIGNMAHFGGFLMGLLYGTYLKMKYKRKVQMLQKMFER